MDLTCSPSGAKCGRGTSCDISCVPPEPIQGMELVPSTRHICISPPSSVFLFTKNNPAVILRSWSLQCEILFIIHTKMVSQFTNFHKDFLITWSLLYLIKLLQEEFISLQALLAYSGTYQTRCNNYKQTRSIAWSRGFPDGRTLPTRKKTHGILTQNTECRSGLFSHWGRQTQACLRDACSFFNRFWCWIWWYGPLN